jgi:hypothetical protein
MSSIFSYASSNDSDLKVVGRTGSKLKGRCEIPQARDGLEHIEDLPQDEIRAQRD